MSVHKVITTAMMAGLLISTMAGALEEANVQRPDVLVADGTPVEIAEKEITVTPPHGWEVLFGVPNMTLVMQPKPVTGERYRRTIQLLTFKGSRYVDEDAADEIGASILKKFPKSSSSIENYRLRNHLPVKLADGNQALLFYTEFTLESVNMMHAHLVISGEHFNYLLTFTDLAEHFESPTGNSEFLSTAWDSMISARVAKLPPTRWSNGEVGALVGTLAMLLGLGIWFQRFRARRVQKFYDRQADDLESASEAGADRVDAWKLATGTASTRLTGPGVGESNVRTETTGYDDRADDFDVDEDDRIAS